MEAGATQKSLAATSLFAKVNNNGKFNRVNDISKDIKIKVLVLNARSIVKMEKRIELESYVKLHGYTIIAITESWTTPDISDNELGLDGFVLFRKDRSEIRVGKGGGVLLYVSNELRCVAVEKLNAFKCESMWIELDDDSRANVIVGVCYKSPIVSEHELKEMFSAIRHAAKSRCLIVGDFNYPNIDWDSWECSKDDDEFVDLIQDNFLFQHVRVATRGNNILDLVFSNEVSMVEDLKVLEHFSTSDHNMLEFQCVLKTGSCDALVYNYNFNKGDYNAIISALNEINWDTVFDSKGTLACYEYFNDRIYELIVRYVPQKKRKTKQKCLWLNTRVKKAIRKRNKKWKLYNATKRDIDYRKYKECRNLVVKELRKARNVFERKLVEDVKNNPKSFYRYVRTKTKSKDRVGPLKDPAGNLIEDDNIMCDTLNNFFASVFTQENTDTVPEVGSVFNGDSSQLLCTVDITSEVVFDKIIKLKDGKAPGDDGIIPEFLKKLASVISKPLAIIFRKSVAEGVVPQEWKRANITPLFKKGSRSDPGNYRPVSLTSHIGKILEAIIKEKLLGHLMIHSLINTSQHGFLPRKSCLTNLLEFLEYVTHAVDSGKPVDVIYLDFQKAFDKVPHARLLNKLLAHGISGKILQWIGEWLNGRQQRVVLNGNVSSWLYVISGVPQGSILGPLLFLIFINDIDKGIVSKLLKFADDTKLVGTVSSEVEIEQLRTDLERLYSWSIDWQMLFNTDKCKVMHFGYKNNTASYSLGNVNIQSGKEEKDLGIIINQTLKSSQQCVAAANTANRTLGMINRTFVNKHSNIMLRLYQTLVRPKLEYCVQAWRPYLKKDIDLLEKVQRRATRLMTSDKSLSYTDRLQKFGLTTLETRRLRGDLIEVFKMFKGFDNIALNDFFKLSSTTLRGHTLKIYKPQVNLDVRKFFFTVRIIDVWNSLPVSLINCETVATFKKHLDCLLKNRGFI